MLGSECQQFVGGLQQRRRLEAEKRARVPGEKAQRVSQCGGMGEPARLVQRRAALAQCVIDMSEAREQTC